MKPEAFFYGISYFDEKLVDNKVLASEVSFSAPDVDDFVLIDRKIYRVQKKCWITGETNNYRGLFIIVSFEADLDTIEIPKTK